MLDMKLVNYLFKIIVLFRMTLLKNKYDQGDSYWVKNKLHFLDPFIPSSVAYSFN